MHSVGICAAKGTAALGRTARCTVVHIGSVSESREKQLEEWRYQENPNTAYFERMEHLLRPVVYGVEMDVEAGAGHRAGHSTYKLVLEHAGEYFYALEVEEMPFLHQRSSTPLPVPLGGTLVLRPDTVVCDGVVLLQRATCEYLGGSRADLNADVAQKCIALLQAQLRR